MKKYPSIPYPGKLGSKRHLRFFDRPVIAFDKLDGSNLRATWNSKRGFYKFGQRKRLIDGSHPLIAERGERLILDKYSEDLATVFKRQGWREATAFFEFYGPSSFAGSHQSNEEQTVTLLDIDVYKKGLLEPRPFLDLFGHLGVPQVLYRGRLTEEFRHSVFTSQLEGMTFEGVVAKGARFRNKPFMFKLKSSAWYDRLRERCAGDDELFQRLA